MKVFRGAKPLTTSVMVAQVGGAIGCGFESHPSPKHSFNSYDERMFSFEALNS